MIPSFLVVPPVYKLEPTCPFASSAFQPANPSLSCPQRIAPTIGVVVAGLPFPALSCVSPHPTVNPPWWLFQVTYLPFTVFTIGLLLCSEVFLPCQLPVMGSFLQLSRCTKLGVQKSKFGFYETFGVGDALKPPCVFRIFDYLFPVAFEIYVTPTSSHSP